MKLRLVPATKLLGIVLCFFTFSGCMSPREGFDCPPGKGVGCHSISQVNQLVDKKEWDRGPDIYHSEALKREDRALLRSELLDEGDVHRITEEHLRVWLAPFQDEQGNLHEASIIHTVLKPGYWIVGEQI